jgi:hypothetical protein
MFVAGRDPQGRGHLDRWDGRSDPARKRQDGQRQACTSSDLGALSEAYLITGRQSEVTSTRNLESLLLSALRETLSVCRLAE